MSHEKDLALMRPDLLRYAMLRLRDCHQAEDAVQDALVAALEGVDRFAASSSLRTWAGGILKHKIADRLHAAGREEPLEGEADLPGSDPEAGFAGLRFLETVEAALKRLPQNAARVFMLREVLGFEPAEVCERLAISAPNCWVSPHRAKARLRVLVPNEV
ncbi:MAG: sigma-70 family RNA polymerase sigma factor [Betaproteobacteria bacterium]